MNTYILKVLFRVTHISIVAQYNDTMYGNNGDDSVFIIIFAISIN